MNTPFPSWHLIVLLASFILIGCHRASSDTAYEPIQTKSIGGYFKEDGLDLHYQFIADIPFPGSKSRTLRKYPGLIVTTHEVASPRTMSDLSGDGFSVTVNGREVLRRTGLNGGLFFLEIERGTVTQIEQDWPLEILSDESVLKRFLERVIRDHRDVVDRKKMK